MRALSIDELEAVVGGMRWEHFRRSTNVEDRRNWAVGDSLNAVSRPPPLPPRRPRRL